MTFSLKKHSCYLHQQSQVIWQGEQIIDADEFESYLRGRVYNRLTDAENREPCVAELTALATTGMESDFLAKFLVSEPVPEPWAVGEAIAECLLADIQNVVWPWNAERDKRTPKASLPGADLVGFFIEGNDVFLLLGEVKTSEHKDTPPGVMNGRSGMIHQLDNLATEISTHFCLIKWLHPRCQTSEFRPLYEKAIAQYIKSKGRALILYGLLMRDTNPHELDLKNRATKLARTLVAPTRLQLAAWYFPCPVSDWSKIATGGTG